MEFSKPFNKYFDHTLLKADATQKEIARLCKEAIEYDFYSVCVNPCHVFTAKKLLAGTDVKVCCVAGFPLGASEAGIKLAEAESACKNGAEEIDMVINIGAIKDGNFNQAEDEIHKIAKACHEHGALLKVIIETGLLTKEEIPVACNIAEKCKADFVKTSTGFSGTGADTESLKLMKDSVSDNISIKASGGIGNLKTAIAMIEAGADRIGASKSVEIMKEYEGQNSK